MKLLLDQDVYALTERFLREQGYDVMTALDLREVRAELKKVLETYKEHELAKTFVVVEKNRHRFRKIE